MGEDNNMTHYVNRLERNDEIKKELEDKSSTKKGKVIFEWYGISGIGKTVLGFEGIGKICKEQNIPFVFIEFGNKNYQIKSLVTEEKYQIELFYKNRDNILIELLKIIMTIISGKDYNNFWKSLKEYSDNQTSSHPPNTDDVIDSFVEYFFEILSEHVMLVFDQTEKLDRQVVEFHIK